MACFIAPAAEAVVTSIIAKKSEKHEENVNGRIPFSRKIKWLSNMLWGGSALLVFEHVWHGEAVPFFPFLTAASTPAGAVEMLKEIASAGMVMGLMVTAVWGGMIAVVNHFEKAAGKNISTAK